ncbi:conserved hypothetical protein [Aeromonas salmonicida subsp. salmonicida A449]|uniref:PsiF repeat-containing protein n=2 Tax=Aeromonas salmonicida subsp. salmonicida TaxID=29491 RepID=A4SQ60_AERS4|nr:conserved hypothetical protein [Aeromonas salmonicida subsp. salmonicida A449]
MALDFIGVGERGVEAWDWLAVEEWLAGGNPALPIGAIVRARWLPCAPFPKLARRGICGNNQLLQSQPFATHRHANMTMQTHHQIERRSPMKRTILFGLLCGSLLLANPVFANDSAQLQCEAQAAAKKLNGAAKTSFVGKCVKDAAGAATGECEKAAADKKLAGAAKNSFIQKCVKTGAAIDPAAKCEKAAADKKLAGAAKNSFVQKCVKDSAAK